jgi:hypothetical protein
MCGERAGFSSATAWRQGFGVIQLARSGEREGQFAGVCCSNRGPGRASARALQVVFLNDCLDGSIHRLLPRRLRERGE